MDWATISTIVGAILTTFSLNRLYAWRRADKIDRRFDDLTKLLTDNLIVINREMGELKGASHKHVVNE